MGIRQPDSVIAHAAQENVRLTVIAPKAMHHYWHQRQSIEASGTDALETYSAQIALMKPDVIRSTNRIILIDEMYSASDVVKLIVEFADRRIWLRQSRTVLWAIRPEIQGFVSRETLVVPPEIAAPVIGCDEFWK
ncbi:hypothetical protein WK77_16705 [Burkholderia ubonensis]|nr:hypothetical protein WK77_16705 [Burkholderia ubonensis]